MSDYANVGHDEWLDALAAGEGYFLRCPEGHASLPPRRVCPHCGDGDLAETPLPESGTVETYTVTHVASPGFADDVPYVTAIARFGRARLTGQLRGVDHDDVEVGTTVGAGVGERETTGERVIVLEPR